MNLRQASEKCHSEMLQFSECAQAHPSNWGTMCGSFREKVVECTQSHLPTLAGAALHCEKLIDAYNECQDGNGGSVTKPHQKCMQQFRDAMDCVQTFSGSAVIFGWTSVPISKPHLFFSSSLLPFLLSSFCFLLLLLLLLSAFLCSLFFSFIPFPSLSFLSFLSLSFFLSSSFILLK